MKKWLVLYVNNFDSQIIFTETDNLGEAHRDLKKLQEMVDNGELKATYLYGRIND